MELFKKSIIVGVSITPEQGLEVAQIDFNTQTVLKYGFKPLAYDINSRKIADLDLFKETLQDLFFELAIPKGAEVVLSIPTISFKVGDYPAALDEMQIMNVIEEELAEHPIFKSFENEPVISPVMLPSASMQFRKIAYTAAQKAQIVEIAMAVKDLGYKLREVDVSVNTVFNALMYRQRVDVNPNTTWLLMLVEEQYCRTFLMNGKTFVDAFEDKISIGEVLGDAENYSTVISAVAPRLKNMPSKYLCVVSKTSVISAEVLASKLTYSAPIIHQEANCFNKEVMLNAAPGIDERAMTTISMDVIGAAISADFEPYAGARFNLFNESLGAVYMAEQPPALYLGGRKILLTNEFLIKFGIALLILALVPVIFGFIALDQLITVQKDKITDFENKIVQIQGFLKQNENISSELFDEGDEIRMGLVHNKNIYSYYTIVGTEIPKKLWLTGLSFGEKITIEGQADNLESVYSFFRSLKDYDPSSEVKLQKLGLAAKSSTSMEVSKSGNFDTDSILTSLNADFYEFTISNDSTFANKIGGTIEASDKDKENDKGKSKGKSKKKKALPNLEPIEELN